MGGASFHRELEYRAGSARVCHPGSYFSTSLRTSTHPVVVA